MQRSLEVGTICKLFADVLNAGTRRAVRYSCGKICVLCDDIWCENSPGRMRHPNFTQSSAKILVAII